MISRMILITVEGQTVLPGHCQRWMALGRHNGSSLVVPIARAVKNDTKVGKTVTNLESIPVTAHGVSNNIDKG